MRSHQDDPDKRTKAEKLLEWMEAEIAVVEENGGKWRRKGCGSLAEAETPKPRQRKRWAVQATSRP